MGNTVFYRDVQAMDSKIKWKDILSERKIKHSKEELEYAMTSGMAINTADESDMLRKWHKPWVFNRVLIIGLILMAFVYGTYIVMALINGLVPIFSLLAIVVPPIVIPLAVLCFFWELNIPKNISLFDLLGAFFIGGILSLAISMLVNVVLYSAAPGLNDSMFSASFAPVAEEPGKFIAAIIVLAFFQKKNKKIYGVTALIIGAAVGAGFSAFESVQYVFNGFSQAGIIGSLQIMFIRLFGSFGCHTLWAAMYTAAFGLACSAEKKISVKGLFKWDVWKYFIIACIMHAVWNTIGIGNLIAECVLLIVQIAIQWAVSLNIVKRCLEQVITIGNYKSGTAMSYSEQMRGLGGSKEAPQNVKPEPEPVPVPQYQPEPMDKYNATRALFGDDRFGDNRGAGEAIPFDVRGPQEDEGTQALFGNQRMDFEGTKVEIVQPVEKKIMINCTGGFLSGRNWEVSEKSRVFIGRGTDCQIRFESAASGVSRNHCEISYDGSQWCITDMNSTNGTFVNNNRLESGAKKLLNDGDSFSLSTSGQTFSVKYIV